MTSLEACVTLNLIPGMGPIRMRRLMDRFGSPEAILAARASELRSTQGIVADVADAIAHWEKHADPQAEIARAEKFGARIVAQSDPDYPPLLREIHDPPILLYVWGSLKSTDRTAIGVVGTRKPSHYALTTSKKLSYQMAYAGVTVVSGLARGIDTAAHQGAIAANGRTIAVIGSGLERLYPPDNQELAELISQNGAVVTEFPMQFPPDRRTFPMRNRIISGMAFGILVIEAGFRSGALISANQAGEQGRSLYAVPGRIDSPNAMGSNTLIQQGAKLVMSAQDILDDFQILFPTQPEILPPSPREQLSVQETAVYDAIGDDPTSPDEIISKSRLPSGEVFSTLLALEMKRLVKQLPGTRFTKLR